MKSTLEIDEFEVVVEWRVLGVAGDKTMTIEFEVAKVTEYFDDAEGPELISYSKRQCRQFEDNHSLGIEGRLWELQAKFERDQLEAFMSQAPAVNYDYNGPRNYVPVGDKREHH